METTCNFRDKCPIINIKQDRLILVGDCIISKSTGSEICKVCDDKFKKLIIKETKNGNIKKV
jgi:hypothetical protein